MSILSIIISYFSIFTYILQTIYMKWDKVSLSYYLYAIDFLSRRSLGRSF